MPHTPLAWHTAALTPDGYGDEARSFLRGLEDIGAKPSLNDLSTWTKLRAGLSETESAQLNMQQKRYADRLMNEGPAPMLHVHHYVPGIALSHHSGRLEALHVSRTMFETDRMPASWMPHLARMEEIWVPSQFNVDTFTRSGYPESRIKVLGETIDFELFSPERAGLEPLKIEGIPDNHTVFLANFDFSDRKGWQQLLMAWAKAFDRNDPVCLLLKAGAISTDAAHIHQRVEDFWGQKRLNAAPLVVFSESLEAEQMPSLYAAADVYVLPTRGEGWGRPYMEAMAMGLPTVASRFSGLLDFMNDEDCWLIDGEMVDIPADFKLGNGLYAGHRWFEADVDQLASVLSEIASDLPAARQHAQPARARMLQEFSAEILANRVVELADDVYARRIDSLRSPYISLWLRETPVNKGAAGVTLALKTALENQTASKYEINQHPLPEALEGLRGLVVECAVSNEAMPLLVLLDNEQTSPAILAAVAKSNLDLLLVSDAQRQQEMVAAGVPPGLIEVVDGSAWQAALNESFADSAVPVMAALEDLQAKGTQAIRAVKAADIEGSANKVLCIPNFHNDGWAEDIADWASRQPSQEDLTLIIWGQASGAEYDKHESTMASSCAGLAGLPDMLMIEAGDKDPLSAALSCQSLLVGERMISTPQLLRLLGPLDINS
jgi:glycosyltransferase involved in cell wall biosynthesis